MEAAPLTLYSLSGGCCNVVRRRSDCYYLVLPVDVDREKDSHSRRPSVESTKASMSNRRKRSRAEADAAIALENEPNHPNHLSSSDKASHDKASSEKSNSNDDDYVLGSRTSLPSLLLDSHQRTSKKTSRSTPAVIGSGQNSSSSASTLFGRVMQQSSEKAATASVHQTPTKQAPIKCSSFLSPGGFALRSMVESAASPFCFRQHDNSNSALLATPTALKPTWRQASTIESIPWDWSLKERVVLLSSAFDKPSAWRWMQNGGPSVDSSDNTSRSNRWNKGRSYWQHPASLSPAATASSNFMDSQRTESMLEPSKLSSKLEPSKLGSKLEARAEQQQASPSERAWQQLQYPSVSHDTSVAEQEWSAAFLSLYRKWQLAPGISSATTAYFYSYGTDHTLLFRYNDADEPEVLISSCGLSFRDWLKSQGILLRVGLQDDAWVEDGWKVQTGDDTVKNMATNPTSPAVAAELAALRRAQVFGQTVGAGVSISYRSRAPLQALQQRRRWLQQVQPLRGVGADACSAVAEYYHNCRGQIMGTRGNISTLPFLMAPSTLGAFSHASLQQLSVRLAPGRVDVLGTLLPGNVRDLIAAAVEFVDLDEDEEEEGAEGRLEVRSTLSRQWASRTVRPMDDAVVGQSTLCALEDETGELVTQVVWDGDEPDHVSFKVEPVAAT
jgi:hypothetical protein